MGIILGLNGHGSGDPNAGRMDIVCNVIISVFFVSNAMRDTRNEVSRGGRSLRLWVVGGRNSTKNHGLRHMFSCRNFLILT